MMALDLAKKASSMDEIPVGAIIVRDGELISGAGYLSRSTGDPTMHAEIIAIKEACRVLGNERLTGCSLFVTKEPCSMCAGAIVHARIERVIIAAEDVRYGACGTVISVCGNELLNHVPEITFGLLRDKSSLLLKKFFKEKRESKKLIRKSDQ